MLAELVRRLSPPPMPHSWPRTFSPLRRLVTEYAAIARSVDLPTLARYSAALVTTAPAIVRSRQLVAADRRMVDHRVAVRSSGQWLAVPGRHFGLVRELHCRRVYNLEPGFEVGAGDQVVDLGANVGAFTVAAALGGAEVVAVEAQDGFASGFWELMRLNGVEGRVRLVHGLIGDGVGALGDRANAVEASHALTEPPSLTMSALLSSHGVEHVDLLKVDIEGSEFALFDEAEAQPWLRRVDRIVMEVHADFGVPAALQGRLEGAGFRVTRYAPSGARVDRGDAGDGFIYAKRMTDRSP